MNIFSGIADFNINRYLGKWYQIAAYPTFFYGGRHTNVTAEYTLEGNGIKVINKALYICLEDNIKVCNSIPGATCYKGRVLTALSEGKGLLTNLPGVFAVGFGNTPVTANYYILYLVDGSDGYEISVVSEPSRNTLFLLSRSPNISRDDMNAVLTYLLNAGFDLTKLLFTAHSLV